MAVTQETPSQIWIHETFELSYRPNLKIERVLKIQFFPDFQYFVTKIVLWLVWRVCSIMNKNIIACCISQCQKKFGKIKKIFFSHPKRRLHNQEIYFFTICCKSSRHILWFPSPKLVNNSNQESRLVYTSHLFFLVFRYFPIFERNENTDNSLEMRAPGILGVVLPLPDGVW